MRNNRTKRQGAVAGIAAAFAVFGSGLAAQPAEIWQADQDDAFLFQILVAKFKIDGDVRGYRTDHGFCVDLGDVIQSLDLPVRLDKKSRRATGWLFAEDQTFTIDRESNTVQIKNTRSDLAPGEMYDTPEGWCTATDTLSRWFDVQITVDPYNSLLKLQSDKPLPFIEAIERRSRAARLRGKRQEFDLSKLPQADMPYQTWRTPSVDMAVNFQFDQRPNSGLKKTATYELYASGEVAGASFDARLASDRNGAPRSLRIEAYRYDPDGGLLGPLKATKVAIGDVETNGASLAGRSGIGRGAIITNQPLQRPTSFAKTTIRGSMPVGWDAELYRNHQLIAFQGDGTDGRYEFVDIDLLFGNNDFEVVLYGPQGQIRREASSFPVGMQSIEPGKTHYWAAAIEQGHDLLEFDRNLVDPTIGWRWGVGVERGIDDRTSAAITAQSLVFNGRRNNYLEMNLRRALGPMLVELSAAQSFGRGRAYRAQALGRVGKVNFDAQTLWIDGDFESDVIQPNLRSESRLTFNTSLKMGRMFMPIEMGARRETWRDGTKVDEWLIRGSLVGAGLSLTAELGQLSTDRPYGPPSVDDGLRLQLLANTRIGRVDLRGEAKFRLSGPSQGFVSASLVGQTPLTERSDLRVQVEHYQDLGRTDFSLGYIRQFKKFSLQAEGRLGTDGSIGAGLALSFSMGPDPARGGIRFSSEKLARTGQTAVTVFLDENGDGLQSPGEKPIADVGVEAGMRATDALTDKDGHAIIEGMKPYVPVLVSIDTGSLPDIYLQPQGKGVVVTPRPGVAAEILLPLSPTGEIEGTIFGLAGTPRAGVEIELVDALGSVVASTLSEFDGFFLFEAVPYGHYSLRISTENAKILGAKRAIASGVAVSRENESERLGVIKLQPDTIAQADAAHVIALAAAN